MCCVPLSESVNGWRCDARPMAGRDAATRAAAPDRGPPQVRACGQADFVAVIPGFTRLGDRGVRYEASSAIERVPSIRHGSTYRSERQRLT